MGSKTDFFNNLDKVFYPNLIGKLKAHDYSISTADTAGFTELVISIGFEEMIDDFKVESAAILRFKQFNGKWKLYAYQLVG